MSSGDQNVRDIPKKTAFLKCRNGYALNFVPLLFPLRLSRRIPATNAIPFHGARSKMPSNYDASCAAHKGTGRARYHLRNRAGRRPGHGDGVLPWLCNGFAPQGAVRNSGLTTTLPATTAGRARSCLCLVVLPRWCSGFAPSGTVRSSGVTTTPPAVGGRGDHDGVAFFFTCTQRSQNLHS